MIERANYQDVDLSFYTDMEIDISNVCNLKCPLCHRETKGAEAYQLDKSIYIETSTIQKIIKDFPNLERVYLGFLICEPTLNPNFLEIVKVLKEANKKITLSTNANTFAKDIEKHKLFWEEFLGLLEEDDKIIWPVDGFNEEIYQTYRRKGTLKNVLFNIARATNINPNINHTIQTIIFHHNQEHIKNGYEAFKEEYTPVFNNPVWSIIDCCGDCSLNAEDIKPAWDKEAWKRIRANPPKSKNIVCESKENRIIFVDHLGRIGFCPTQLTNSVMVSTIESEVANVKDSPEDIQKYINSVYGDRDNNKICQFNCGKMAKLKKKALGLESINTK